jgi:hypothetical protein
MPDAAGVVHRCAVNRSLNLEDEQVSLPDAIGQIRTARPAEQTIRHKDLILWWLNSIHFALSPNTFMITVICMLWIAGAAQCG